MQQNIKILKDIILVNGSLLNMSLIKFNFQYLLYSQYLIIRNPNIIPPK